MRWVLFASLCALMLSITFGTRAVQAATTRIWGDGTGNWSDLPPSPESTFGVRIQSLDITRRRAFDATRSEVQSGRDHREAA